MCGSTLEYNNGAATENIEEILTADISEETAVVIETGGSDGWSGYNIPNDNICRYYVKNGELIQKEKLPNANMGDVKTLKSFLEFCNNNYPAESKAVIFWNHGDAEGICYDQNYDFDKLTIPELKEAFSETSSYFDLIGFDACLMSNYDAVIGVSDYADYLLASEEIEPVGGWDYKTFIETFDKQDDIKSVGQAVCDSYLEKSKRNNNSDIASLALIDLSKTSTLSSAFDNFMKEVTDISKEFYGNFEVVTAINKTVKLGANSKFEGFSNLIDLQSFANTFENADETSSALSDAIADCVVYKVSGNNRKTCGGISLYYPQHYLEKQLDEYLSVCESKEYIDYLNMHYSDIPETTIEFLDDGSTKDNETFEIKLSKESKKYLKSVEFYLLEFSDSDNYNSNISKLGADNDIFSDWENMTFKSNFRGVWIGLDGHQLCYTISECNDDQIIFESPVMVNGELTNLRFSFTFDESYENGGCYDIIGLWDGLDKNGLPSKKIRNLNPGDSVVLLKKDVFSGDYSTYYDKSDELTFNENSFISETPLSNEYYQYVYAVSDIFGNTFFSKSAVFQMQYSSEELTNNPLPDGKSAAKIISIDYVDNELVYDNIE